MTPGLGRRPRAGAAGWAAALAGLVGALVLVTGAAAPARAAEGPAGARVRAPRPVIAVAFATPDVVRSDRQLPTAVSVTFTGVDARSTVAVDWADGTMAVRARGRCGSTGARAYPAACAVTIGHEYAAPGTYRPQAWARGARAAGSYTIVAAPVRWRPPVDEPAHPQWAHDDGLGAVYTPCESIPWFYDAAAQPADRATMKADVALALDMIAAETGLRFTETTDRSAAKLVLDWSDLKGYGSDVAGYGGFHGYSDGYVTFSTTNSWTRDTWAGPSLVRSEWDTPDGWHWWEEKQGRTWLVIHEVMHALGVAHVNDTTQIMNPTITRSQWGEGDLAALHTMYKDLGCPVIPD